MYVVCECKHEKWDVNISRICPECGHAPDLNNSWHCRLVIASGVLVSARKGICEKCEAIEVSGFPSELIDTQHGGPFWDPHLVIPKKECLVNPSVYPLDGTPCWFPGKKLEDVLF